jgi:hypothetical protein
MPEISKLINNKEFIRLADKYAPFITDKEIISYEKILAEKFNKLEVDELKIPIIGVQGTGKSSLINALLFNDIVLPVDADETTCIPVEIKYHDEPLLIKIYFNNGNCLSLDDYKELDKYVNNNFNPENEKEVEKVIIYTNNAILKNNLVLVDLPGVGSITQRNEKVTLEYVENMCYGIFLLRTVPPITRSESFFLKSVWPILLEAMFIQNRWNDESEIEVEDGKQHNLKILKNIAQEKNTNPDVKINVINIYKALIGRIEDNDSLISNSGIESLVAFLKGLGENWKERISLVYLSNLRILTEKIKFKIQNLINDISLSIDELKEKLIEEEKRTLKNILKNKDKIHEINKKIYIHKIDLISFIKKRCRIAKEDLRNAMRNVIEAGVVDGNNLSRAFEDNQKNQWLYVNEDINLKFEEIQRDLQVDIDEQGIKTFKGRFEEYSQFKKKQAFKIEKGIPYATSIGGSIGAIYAGAAIAGPFGYLVGGLIVLISVTLGSKAKEKLVKIRQEHTLRDLESPLNSFEDSLNNSLSKMIDNLLTHLENNLVKFEETQMRILEKDKEDNRKIIQLDQEERKKYKEELQKDLNNVIAFEGELNDGK